MSWSAVRRGVVVGAAMGVRGSVRVDRRRFAQAEKAKRAETARLEKQNALPDGLKIGNAALNCKYCIPRASRTALRRLETYRPKVR